MEEFKALCRDKGLRIGFFNVGDFMHRAAAASGIQFTDKVLDSDPAVLSLARRSAFYEIANIAHDYDHTFVGLHACFRWNGKLVSGVSFKDMQGFLGDVFINVVDNLADIAQRIEDNPQWMGMRRDEINVWLDEEEFLTKQFANLKEKDHYTIARQHNLENFYDLLFSKKKKFYLSYPITLLRQDAPDQIESIRKFGSKMRKHFIIFDPLDIADMDLIHSVESPQEGANAGEVTTVSDIDQNFNVQIKTRTISRDYQFIHQSDFVIVLYPTDKLSPGVLSEMNFASRYNKPVYAVYSHARSPFFEHLCERIFDSIEELETFLRDQQVEI